MGCDKTNKELAVEITKAWIESGREIAGIDGMELLLKRAYEALARLEETNP